MSFKSKNKKREIQKEQEKEIEIQLQIDKRNKRNVINDSFRYNLKK